MSHLEVLTLKEPVPLSLCFFFFHNVPTLWKLSLKDNVIPEDGLRYEDVALASTLSSKDIFRPFTHGSLQYLALSHYKTDLSAFNFATLPQLHFLLLDLCKR